MPDLNATAAIEALRPVVQQQTQQQINKDMWGLAGNLGLAGLGAGVGARSLWGLLQQISRNARQPQHSIPSPVEFEIPVEEVEEKKATAYESFKDTARSGLHATGRALSGAGTVVGDFLNSMTEGAGELVGDYASGRMATTPAGNPMALPLWMAAAGGGALGGWKLTDWLLDQRRRRHLQQELEDAEQEYNDALFGKVSEDLNAVFEALEKRAEGEQSPWTAGNVAGMLGGGALTWAALSSLLGASYGWNSARARSRRALLEQAQRERQRQRMEAMPTPMYAVPVPVSQMQEQEEEEFNAAPSL